MYVFLSVYAALNGRYTGKIGWLYLSALFCGAAAATKYTGVACAGLVAPLILAPSTPGYSKGWTASRTVRSCYSSGTMFFSIAFKGAVRRGYVKIKRAAGENGMAYEDSYGLAPATRTQQQVMVI